MKRNFQLTTINGKLPPLKKTRYTTANRVTIPLVRTALGTGYGRRSYVPLRTGGYRPNNIEKKVVDVDSGTVPVSTAGSFTLLNCPTQGSDMTNRIGRKITCKSIYIRGKINTDGSDIFTNAVTVTSQYVRMIIFCDYQPNASTPAVTDLLKQATSFSQLNINNRDRFKILHDKAWVLDPWVFNTTSGTALVTGTNQVRLIKKYKKINIETIFNNNSTGAIGDITSGAIYVFFIGDRAPGVSVDGAATFTVRLRFTDL